MITGFLSVAKVKLKFDPVSKYKYSASEFYAINEGSGKSHVEVDGMELVFNHSSPLGEKGASYPEKRFPIPDINWCQVEYVFQDKVYEALDALEIQTV